MMIGDYWFGFGLLGGWWWTTLWTFWYLISLSLWCTATLYHLFIFIFIITLNVVAATSCRWWWWHYYFQHTSSSTTTIIAYFDSFFFTSSILIVIHIFNNALWFWITMIMPLLLLHFLVLPTSLLPFPSRRRSHFSDSRA